MTLFRSRLGSVLFLAILGVASAAVPHAARTDVAVVPVSGIGTQLGNIDTRVEAVTHSEPVLVEIPEVGAAFEMHGVVSGIGWGGTGIVSRARDAHYAYEVSYVARWPQHGGGHLLVAYYHGGPPPAVAVLQADRRLGADESEPLRRTLRRRAGRRADACPEGHLCSFNRRGLRPDGTYRSEVPDHRSRCADRDGSRESARGHCPGRPHLYASGPRCRRGRSRAHRDRFHYRS